MMRSGFWRLLVIGLVALLPLKTAQSVADNVLGTGSAQASGPATTDRQAKIAATVSLPLQARISEAAPDDKLRVIVRFVSAAGAPVGAVPPAGAGARREVAQTLVSQLQRDARDSQNGALSWLQEPLARGAADSVRPFWIFNGLALRATPAVIEALAARSDVLSVSEDRWLQRIRPDTAADATPEQRVRNTTIVTNLISAETPPDPGNVTWGVNKIKADVAWRALGVDGDGIVVANIDTGVDWNHPALNASYRGRGNGIAPDHLHNWIDTTDEGATYPSDPYGHGTHTMGTIVGSNGIGVAPGARWMAAKALNSQGFGLDSWLHAALEFMLAPGGDSSAAPDVVNNSWGNGNASDREFGADIVALQQAGIFVVFSNGNSGPAPSSVGAPASDPNAIGVGATDPDDDAAFFSSRGPSPINGAIKPNLAAPGVNVLSTFPGGAYMSMNGTSMAAPHVAGTAALILSAQPALSIGQVYDVLTRTATPLQTVVPNNNTGWGRIDAYAAVLSVLSTGTLDGYVRDAEQPVSNATVTAIDSVNNRVITTTTDANGYYAMQPLPGQYVVSASAFGYASGTAPARLIALNTPARIDLQIDYLPSGTVRGTIRDAQTGAYITATVRALGTPKVTTSNNNCLPCRYALDLPAGAYTLEVRANGYRIQTQTVTIGNGQLSDLNFGLQSMLKIAFVNTGPWYYASAAEYYRRVFEAERWAIDEYSIKRFPQDTPTITTLLRYDAVIWSSPFDSPGIIGADDVLSRYLSTGKGLILTGQDIAAYDGGIYGYSPYFLARVNAVAKADTAAGELVRGADGGGLDGASFPISGGDGANNLRSADEVAVLEKDYGDVLARYVTGTGITSTAATLTAPCSKSRAAHFGFGLETIATDAERAAVISRTLSALVAPKPAYGLEALNLDQHPTGAAIAARGVVTHVLRLRNTGAGGTAQTYEISASGGAWPVQLSSSQITLKPCESVTVTATVTIPDDAGRNVSDTTRIRLQLPMAGLSQEIAYTTKTPSSILLVDDDRWFDRESDYALALQSLGNSFDRWSTNGANGLYVTPGSAFMNNYPVVVWFNAYDWFEPLTPNEEAAMIHYLNQGGRVFYTSQAALAYAGRSRLLRGYFGVDDVDFTDVSSQVVSLAGTALGDGLPNGSLLPFPYSYNLSSAVLPLSSTQVFARGESWQALGVMRDGGAWRTVFAPFAFEALPRQTQDQLMRAIVSWLSPVGASTLAASTTAPMPGESLALTLTTRIDKHLLAGNDTLVTSWSASPGLTLQPLPPAQATPITAGMNMTVNTSAVVAGNAAPGTLLTATVRYTLTELGLVAERTAVFRVGGPQLQGAVSISPATVSWGKTATVTVQLTNRGARTADNASARLVVPFGTTIMTGSVSASLPPAVVRNTVVLSGTLAPGATWRASAVIRLPKFSSASPETYLLSLLVENGMGDITAINSWLLPSTRRQYYPVVTRQ